MSCKGKFNLDASSFNTFSISLGCFISCISPLLNSLQFVSPLYCNTLPVSTFDFMQICVVWDDDYRTENGVIQQFCARALDSNEAQRITTCSAGSISEHQGHLMKFFRSYYLSYSYVCQGLVSCLTRLQGRFVQQARSLRLLSCITDMCPVTGMTECQLFHFFFSYRH